MNNKSAQELEYISRINRVFDYIEAHLEQPMTLDDLASVANFSKFHFSRIFRSMVGETPFQFISRLRIEKAAMLIAANPRESISEIAWKCGFTEISVFSRNFKTQFKISASQYRKDILQNSNISQQESKKHKSNEQPALYFCRDLQTIKWKTKMKLNKSVEIKEIPPMTVAYIRHIGPYKGDEQLFKGLWDKLIAWAAPRGLLGGRDFKSLAVYHDDPDVTIEDKLRLSICITVPPETEVGGEIGKMELEGATCVVARFELTSDDFQPAWDWVCGQWFPTSGYQPDDKPSFEMYPEEPKNGKYTVDICIPVKPL